MDAEYMANGFRVVADLFDKGLTSTAWIVVGALRAAEDAPVQAFANVLNSLAVTVIHDGTPHQVNVAYRHGDKHVMCRCGRVAESRADADAHLAGVLQEETFGCV